MRKIAKDAGAIIKIGKSVRVNFTILEKKINLEQGNRLRECLKDKRMSQKELSEKSDYTPQHISL